VFQIKENNFDPNKEECQSHLSDEELSLKKVLVELIHKFFEFFDEFTLNKTKTRFGCIRSFSGNAFSNR
jgi:hypothetical protein